MKRYITLLVITCAGLSLMQAQSWQERLKEMQKRVEVATKNQSTRINLQYAYQMRRLWEQQTLEVPEVPPAVPEPSVPKAFLPDQSPLSTPQEFLTIPTRPDQPIVDRPQRPEPQADRDESNRIRMTPKVKTELGRLTREATPTYFGERMVFRFDAEMEYSLQYNLNEERIAERWEKLEDSRHALLLYQLTREAERLQLNDWGFAKLVNTMAMEMYPEDKNARVLFDWFMLSKAGYVATVSYNRNNLYLMLPSQQVLYGHTYLRGKAHKFYAVDLDGYDIELKEARVFPDKYPAAKRIMDFRLEEAPRFPEENRRKNLRFSYRDQDYRIPIELNNHVIAFYRTYPFVDLSVYLGAPLSYTTRRSLVDSLRTYADRLTPRRGWSQEQEQVNFLLRFVQTALAYKPDHEQFGKEKYLFADETLYYPFSDCEDRSVLFAYLVEEIVGLEVVGLLYPGHAATAVAFNGPITGDYIVSQGKKYTICDPTYINANCGMALPDTEGKMARVVKY